MACTPSMWLATALRAARIKGYMPHTPPRIQTLDAANMYPLSKHGAECWGLVWTVHDILAPCCSAVAKLVPPQLLNVHLRPRRLWKAPPFCAHVAAPARQHPGAASCSDIVAAHCSTGTDCARQRSGMADVEERRRASCQRHAAVLRRTRSCGVSRAAERCGMCTPAAPGTRCHGGSVHHCCASGITAYSRPAWLAALRRPVRSGIAGVAEHSHARIIAACRYAHTGMLAYAGIPLRTKLRCRWRQCGTHGRTTCCRRCTDNSMLTLRPSRLLSHSPAP